MSRTVGRLSVSGLDKAAMIRPLGNLGGETDGPEFASDLSFMPASSRLLHPPRPYTRFPVQRLGLDDETWACSTTVECEDSRRGWHQQGGRVLAISGGSCWMEILDGRSGYARNITGLLEHDTMEGGRKCLAPEWPGR